MIEVGDVETYTVYGIFHFFLIKYIDNLDIDLSGYFLIITRTGLYKLFIIIGGHG